MNGEFWVGKKVFVTGHTGFKGSWLSLWLQQLGAQVTGYSLKPPTQLNLFEVAQVADGMISITGDIRNASQLANTMRQAAPDIVIHMAAQPLVRRSYVEPIETYSTNVMGTVHLLEAVRQTRSVRAVVNVTSDKCYKNKEWIWGYRENEPMGGFDPYSSSKGCSELVTSAYRNSFFNAANYCDHQVALATVRAGNVIGGGDWAADRLIPDILRGITDGHSVVIRNPNATRPWQHVLEPLNGYLQLAQKLYEHGTIYAESWNFGPEDEDTKPVQWIVEQFTKQWGNGARWECDTTENSHEAHYLKLDCSKAKMLLGWKPKFNLTKAIEMIIEWHRSYQANEDLRNITIEQISNYRNDLF